MNKPEKKDVTIIVNGESHEIPKEKIMYAEVVTLADPEFQQHPERNYSVKYRREHGGQSKILPVGGDVQVTDKMIFNVDPTGQS